MIFPFYAIFLSDPILPDGAISGGYAFVGLVAVVAFFFVRSINQMDRLINEVKSLRLDHNKLRADFDNKHTSDYIDGQNAKIAEIIIAKLKAMTPP